jgi:hypothetical protein
MGIKVKIAKCWIKVENIQQAMETVRMFVDVEDIIIYFCMCYITKYI